jgi:ADP-ribosylglycohydrolase
MIMGSLLADSYALGTHWIYDTDQIDAHRERLQQLIDPVVPRFHANRKAGEHTHYGDQAVLLLESIARNGGFDRQQFRSDWLAAMQGYDGYLDHASKETLAHPETGAVSDDLGGAARIAPLVYRYFDDPAMLSRSADEQTAFTHNSPEAREAAQAAAAVAVRVLNGESPAKAAAAYAGSAECPESLRSYFLLSIPAAGEETRTTVKRFGQMCSLKGALPSALQIIVKYDTDYREALYQNILAGGDSAARGLIIGMIIGASGAPLPEEWLNAYVHREKVEALLDSIDSQRK